MKNIVSWISICLMLIFTAVSVFAAEYQAEDTSRKVYDYAELMSPEENEKLEAYARELSEKYSADFVVVTITENNRISSQDFADRFFEDNFFGGAEGRREDESGDGMVFLIDMQNREYALSTGGLLHKAMGGKEEEKLLDAVAAPMKSGNYYEACQTALSLCAGDVKSYQNSKIWIPALAAFAAASVITAIVLGVMVSFSRKSAAASEAQRYMLLDSFHITRKEEWKTGSHTAVTPIPKASGGGGSGGGSHTSSGGKSHGGGSRGF